MPLNRDRPRRDYLYGRQMESACLCSLVEAARSGRSAVTVLQGEPGIGKSALLDELAGAARGCRVIRLAGVDSQRGFRYGVLQQLCTTLVGPAGRLPEPEADALRTAIGLRAGESPDPVLVGGGALSILAEAAQEQPLICLIDDAQWLDEASAHALTLVARRLKSEAVVICFAVRPGGNDRVWAGLPHLPVRGLSDSHSLTVLDSALIGPLDERVRARIVAESRGNPGTLRALPRRLSPAELHFGSSPGPLESQPGQELAEFEIELEAMPKQSRWLLFIAAAEPLGDPDLIWRAAAWLKVGRDAANPLEEAGLVELRQPVRFRNPHVRSAAYRSASFPEKRMVHRALAQVTSPQVDPDRRAWHRAQAIVAPDDDVAGALERSADRGLSHGGLIAAAVLLERAATLTQNAADRARRQLNAGHALARADSTTLAEELVRLAGRGPLTDVHRARGDVLQAQMRFAHGQAADALPALLRAIRRLESIDTKLALGSYADALVTAMLAERSVPDTAAAEIAAAVRGAPVPVYPESPGTLLKGLAVLLDEGYIAAAPALKQAVQAMSTAEFEIEDGLRFLWLGAAAASIVCDLATWDLLAARHLEAARRSGSLSALSLGLDTCVYVDLFSGRLESAAARVEERRALTSAGDHGQHSAASMALAALRGQMDLVAPSPSGGIDQAVACWAHGVALNGQGRYAEAMLAGRQAAGHPTALGPSQWGLAELIEGAVRSGDRAAAGEAVERLSELAGATGAPWALGVTARSRAMVGDDRRAEELYIEAITRLETAGLRVETARARLVYGEWLRRQGRRRDAREQLRSAATAFSAMGVEAFEQRAHRELAATGEKARRRTVDSAGELTAQELRIAHLAGAGLMNQEIGEQLFISPRTVEWHLRKVLVKLGITQRRQLQEALQSGRLTDGQSRLR